ncbi:glucokinase, putative [Roseobacter denitrificans OCh 114]|uniref:Glucokinase, putative n=1 Tax=Roseobacter denitrificans (strain ATCC 33942 / OCh 114) TaxID=375451 RepID=Q161U9_ROSDO|nr:glucokinase, putative [Roseobacter denitrificans OCh 114]
MVADIGGTNTRVALCDGVEVLKPTIRRYRNADNDGFTAVLAQYLAAEGNVQPRAVCVAIAGPVSGGKGRLTNLDWDMDEAEIAKATGAKCVALLNDLQAQGYALDQLGPGDLARLRKGAATPKGDARLVVNLGTGFNASPVFMTQAGAYVATSESGHANMPIRTDQDLRLCAFIEERHGFAAIDDILSGRGLERVFAFLAHEAGKNRLLNSAQIMSACADDRDELAVQTVRYFVRLTALVIANLALVQLPFGGIYLVGGLSGAIAPYMSSENFEAAFLDKGRFADFMTDFAIYVVQDDYAALKGNAAYLNGLLQG